ncbi:hypothetical protein D9M68_812450 [compost metagenome]
MVADAAGHFSLPLLRYILLLFIQAFFQLLHRLLWCSWNAVYGQKHAAPVFQGIIVINQDIMRISFQRIDVIHARCRKDQNQGKQQAHAGKEFGFDVHGYSIRYKVLH